MSNGWVTAATANTRQRTVGRTGITAHAASSNPTRSTYQTTSAAWSEIIVNGKVATANGGAYR